MYIQEARIGAYTVYAYTIDKAGNQSAEVSNAASKDSTVPNGPTVSPSTSANSNGWYKSNVTVNITAGTDSTSGAYKLRYSTNGGTSYTTTSSGVTTTSVTVSSEGTTNIIAYTIDKAGNVSTSTGTAQVKLDKTAPTISSITSTGTSESVASMTVNASDTGGAGIDQYKFYLGTSTTPKTTSTTKTASVTGLSRGASNTVNVVVTDKAGNESTRTSKTVATKLYVWDYYSYQTIYVYSLTQGVLAYTRTTWKQSSHRNYVIPYYPASAVCVSIYQGNGTGSVDESKVQTGKFNPYTSNFSGLNRCIYLDAARRRSNII